MQATLCFEYGDNVDRLTIEADTLEELQAMAAKEVERRKPDNYWSEDVK